MIKSISIKLEDLYPSFSNNLFGLRVGFKLWLTSKLEVNNISVGLTASTSRLVLTDLIPILAIRIPCHSLNCCRWCTRQRKSSVVNLADGLAKFLIKRTREELAHSLFSCTRGNLEALFPQTKILKSQHINASLALP